MGFPLEYLARRIGIEPDEVEQIMEMRQRELESDPIGMIARQGDITAPQGDPVEDEPE
jgi:hypothetical protein